ncbi:MAG: response regulator [Campylobacterota bacterium]|nr:response regulator [Campylobacterota bacterium]
MNLLEKSTILYVEDDCVIAESFSNITKSIFKKLHVAENGKDGLELYKKYKDDIDIIITDLNMPILGGIDMIKQIRDDNYDIPIVITSAFNDKSTLNTVINLGVDGFVHKPLIFQELIKVLEKLLKPIFYKKELQQKDALLFQQSKFAALGEMIGNIAHQWRQPLNSIGATMMKLELQCDDENIQKKDVDDAIEKTNYIISHMSKTIDDFRNFCSPNKEKIVFSLKGPIQSTISLIASQLAQHNIQININGDENISIYGYENELKQVLINIINNSKDALVSNNIENGYINLHIQTKQNNLILSISDNANGIPNDIIEKMFEPYFTTKFKSQGTGLGLYMSKTICEKNMNGSLSVENDDSGAVFTITLPLS